MSIVNQILKDLEKRTIRTNPSLKAAALPFLRPVKRVHKIRKKLLLLLLFAGIFLLLDAYVITRHFVSAGGSRLKPTKQEYVVDVHKKQLPSSVAGNAVSAGLNGMTVEVQGPVTQLRFLLSKPVLYRMTTSAGGTVYRVTLDNTHAKADMPQLDYTGTAIRSLKLSEKPDGSLEVLFFLRKGVRLQQAGIFPSKSPEFLMNLVYLPPVPQPMQTVPQTPHVLSASSRGGDFSAGSLQMAMKLATAGEIDKAGSLLKSLLDITPDYHPAREALAQLLMQHSRMTEAGMVLRTGLDRYPQWLPYVDLEARWLSAQGKIQAALQVLSQQSPSLEAHPEYYALMAALYQRQNKPQMAAKLYQQLISLQPDHGRWWLGYAIALDGMDKHAEAVSAYMRALQADGEGLSPELKAWAETRVHAG